MEEKDIAEVETKVAVTANTEVAAETPKANVFTLAKKVKVKLSKPIVNNRIAYDAGDTLEVKESTADYIEKYDLGKRV